jgi:chromosome partitioning protein
MKVITFASQKGGVGKTTLTLHVLWELTARKKNVAAFDLDPQFSLADWALRRPENCLELFILSGFALKDIPHRIEQLSDGGAEYVLIDSPPHGKSNEAVQTAIDVCDLVVIPIRPSGFDLWSSVATIKLARERNKPWVFVVTQVNNRSTLTTDFMREIREFGDLCDQTMASRVDYSGAIVGGQTALDYLPGDKPHHVEVQRITDCILSHLE